jgi:hypothetical protein
LCPHERLRDVADLCGHSGFAFAETNSAAVR